MAAPTVVSDAHKNQSDIATWTSDSVVVGSGESLLVVCSDRYAVDDRASVTAVWDSAGVNESLTNLGGAMLDGYGNGIVWFFLAAPTAKTAAVTVTWPSRNGSGVLRTYVLSGAVSAGTPAFNEFTTVTNTTSVTLSATANDLTLITVNIGDAGASGETGGAVGSGLTLDDAGYRVNTYGIAGSGANVSDPDASWTNNFRGVSSAIAITGSAGGGSTATWQLFPSAGAYLDDGTINVSTHSFKARLLSDAYTTDYTDTVLADTTGALGTDQTVTLSVSGGMVSIASDVSWSGALANVRHILIYDDTPTSPADPLLAIVDLGANQSVPTSTTFTLPAGDVYFR